MSGLFDHKLSSWTSAITRLAVKLGEKLVHGVKSKLATQAGENSR
jgi:hypothetical protein